MRHCPHYERLAVRSFARWLAYLRGALEVSLCEKTRRFMEQMRRKSCLRLSMLDGRRQQASLQRPALGLISLSLRLVDRIWILQQSVGGVCCIVGVWLIWSPGHVSGATGGETFFYPNFHAPRDLLKLSRELANTVQRDTGYQALMKVRCSNGLQVSAYHGSFLQHTFGADLEIGSVDADKALGVLFSYDGKLEPKLDAHFQAALLYTSANGQRRVRCINVVAAVNEGGMETMKFVDQDAVVNIIAKEGMSAYLPIQIMHSDLRSCLQNGRQVAEGRTRKYHGENG